MSLLAMIRDAFTPAHRRPLVRENTQLRTEVAKLKEQAERTVVAIDIAAETGVWHQDLLEARGRYRLPVQEAQK